ncbi:MAG: hypothetical protein Q8O76_02125 [Chloroflexota bacterium]|nr:hypothetical protein [Chloroflexota bacterium]
MLLALLVILLVLALGCGPDQPGYADFPAVWDVQNATAEDQGAILRLLDVSPSPRGNDLIVPYVLYSQTSDQHLVPTKVTLTDDTGTLSSVGKVVDLGSLKSASFGVVTFSGLLFESSVLNLRMVGVEGTSQVSWDMTPFMAKSSPGMKKYAEPHFRYVTIGLRPWDPTQVEDMTIKRTESFIVPEGGYQNARSYLRWQVEGPRGDSAEFLYTVSPKGEVRSVTQAEFDRVASTQGGGQ